MADQPPDWATPTAKTPSWATTPAAPQRAPGATGFGIVGQLFGDLTNSSPANHDPNALEQGIMNVASNPLIRGAKATYQQAVTNSPIMNGIPSPMMLGASLTPQGRAALQHSANLRAMMGENLGVRDTMQVMGIGLNDLKTKYPGQTDDWYSSHMNQMYNNAVTSARQQYTDEANAARIGDPGPGKVPTWAQRGERLGQQAINIGANIAASPQYFLAPGMGVGGNAATRIATAGAGNAALGSLSDAAAQTMDQITGIKKDFDIKQNLEATVTSGLFGAALHSTGEVAPFVRSLFGNRGVDTTPMADPRSSPITPLTQDHVPLNQADAVQYRQLLKTGSVDDIKGFFQGRNGSQPSWTDVNTWVEHRDGATRTGPVQDSMQPNFNYESEYNNHVENQWKEQNRNAVEQHVNNQTASWKNAPSVEVVHDPSSIADPEVRAQILRDDPNGDALGVFGSDGKMRIFSSRINDPEVANAVLYHEGLGHFGLAEKFGDRLDQTLSTLLNRNVGQFASRVDAWQKANPGAYDGNRIRAAEEVLAEDSQNGVIKPTWQDAITASIKQFGRKMGLKLGYSDAEVNHILAMSHDAVVNGKPSAAANGFKGATQDPNKFMFAGPKSIGFDPNSPTAFQTPRGDMREEFSDNEARLKNINGSTLGDTLHHPELFQRYPELRDLPVIRKNMEGMSGYYDSDHGGFMKEMGLNPLTRDDPLQTVLHETQHAIQDIEGNLDNKGTTHLSPEDYEAHPMEREARQVEDRQRLTDEERANTPVKFMRKDAMGREQTDHEELDMVDRLKSDPRYWSDREYRQNVNELARTRFPPDGLVNKFITKSQLAAQKNFRVDDLEGVYKALSEGYEPTTRSFDEDRQAALEVGFTPSQIKSLKETNPGELSTRLYRMQSAANMADIKISKLNEKLDTPEWSEADTAEYIKTLADRDYLVKRIRGERSELGRALNVSKAANAYSKGTMQQMKELLEQNGSGLAGLAADPTAFFKFARQLKQVMGPTGPNGAPVNPAGGRAMMQGVTKPYWEQYLTTFHMNMMLSALSTHVKAPIDMATGITRNIIEKTLAMPVGTIRQTFEAMTGKTVKPGVEVAELANHMIGIMRAVTDAEVYRASLHAVKTGESSYVVNGQATPTQFANQFGAVSNPRIPIVSKMTDLISAQDTFFRSVEMNAQLETVAAREARAQLGPRASTTDVMTLGHSLATNPTATMLKDAFAETNRTLLLNDNPINNMINKARTYRPGMNPGERAWAFIVSNLAPFIRVESNNLINRVIQRSPLGLIDPTGYTQSQLKAGGAKADIAITKMLYGTVLIGMAWVAADKTKNYLTGEGPTSVDKYKSQIAGGWRPNAVHENGQYSTGGELGMSVNPFDMHNKTAQMVASMRQAYEEGANKGQVGTGLKLAFGSVFSNLAGMSWVSDMQPAVDAARAHGTEGQSNVSAFLSKEAGTWLPNGLNQTARLTDPNQRDTSSPDSISGAVGNEWMSEVPGLREQLPVKYSVYGTPLANGASLTGVHTIIPGLSGNGTTETHDPAERELDRLNSQIDNSLITPVQKTITLENGDKKKLTPAEFEEYQRVAGRAIVETVRSEMNTDQWLNMSDQDRILEVRSIQTDMKKAARGALFNQ